MMIELAVVEELINFSVFLAVWRTSKGILGLLRLPSDSFGYYLSRRLVQK